MVCLDLSSLHCAGEVNSACTDAKMGHEHTDCRPDWSEESKGHYYNYTNSYVQPIYLDILQVYNSAYDLRMDGLQPSYNNNNCNNYYNYLSVYSQDIEHTLCDSIKQQSKDLYRQVTGAIAQAALDTVFKKRSHHKKFWWDDDLNTLKAESILSHNEWIRDGRPILGDSYARKTKAKLAYKKAIKSKRKNAEGKITDRLHDQLTNCNQTGFWKTWKNCFNQKQKNITRVEGLLDEGAIANKFANHFADICHPLANFAALSVKGVPETAGSATIIGNKSQLSASATPFCPKGSTNRSMTFADRLHKYIGPHRVYEHHVDIGTVNSIICGLKLGKATGFDLISAEHLKYSHPIVASCLHMLFSLFVGVGSVPDAFARGVITPLPKMDGNSANHSINDYRGITVSPIISKVFESCLLEYVKTKMSSSPYQFGFKKNHSCSGAIFLVKKTVDEFVSKGNTVNICALDISKAFDQVDNMTLLEKLMLKNFPRCFVVILYDWFSKSNITVKWGNAISHSVRLLAGVRQGSILAPFLFAIFIDDVLVKLGSSGLGCHLKSVCFNAIMYADDLLLLSTSITELQKLIDLANMLINSLGLILNASKSICIRIGRRHKIVNCKLSLNGSKIGIKSELRYLGIGILSGTQFRVNLQSVKQSFFRAANGVLGKIGCMDNPAVALSLINSFCLPILLYGMEGLDLNNSTRSAIDFVYNSVFCKLFDTKDSLTIAMCQFYSGNLPASYLLDLRSFNFYTSLNYLISCPSLLLHNMVNLQALERIRSRYSIGSDVTSVNSRKEILWNHFRLSLAL